MILLNIDFTVKPHNRRELLQTLTSIFEKGERERGLVSRRLYRDAQDMDRFNIREEWGGEADLRRYLKGDLFGVLLGALNLLGESKHVRTHMLTDFLDEYALISLRNMTVD